MTGVLTNRENLDIETPIDNERYRVKMAIYRLKREAWNRSYIHGP